MRLLISKCFIGGRKVLGEKMIKRMINNIKSFLGECSYGIGFNRGGGVPNLADKLKVEWMRGVPKDRWYADPFILEVSDNVIHLLVERFKYADRKGVLCRLEIDKESCRLLKESVILELPTHLSFPFIYEENGKVYVMPENYQSGKLSIYEYDKDADTLVNPQVVIEEPLVDSVCKKIDDAYYIFAIRYCDNFQEAAKTLYIYRSARLFGPYLLIQTINDDKAHLRGAGAIIEAGDDYIRPSQDCERGYGKGVIFSKLLHNDGQFALQECGRLTPIGQKFSEGLHTYNQKYGIYVIDGYGYRRGVLAKLLGSIYKKMKRC